MAGPGGPGSARFRSARAGPAGVREAAAQQKREPDAELERPSGTTPELDPARSRRCACVLPAAPPGASGRRLVGRLRRFHSRLSSRELGDSSRRGSSIYSKTAKRGSPRRVARKRNPVPTGRREGHAATPFMCALPIMPPAAPLMKLVATHILSQGWPVPGGGAGITAEMEDGGAGVEATEPEGVQEPEEAPWTGDGAPGSRPAQLHAQVAGASLRPLPDDRPEFCRGRNECFITVPRPLLWVPGQT